ncbi:MAG: hypothetical protein ABI323_02730 [Solirubrobacteraceae bacterium]
MVADVLRLGPLLGLVLVLGVLVSACGSSQSTGSTTRDVAQVEQTLTRAFRALASGDGGTVCALATASGRRTLAASVPNTDCASVVTLVSEHLSPGQRAALASVQIHKVTVKGRSASVSDSDITAARGSLKGFIQPHSAPTRLVKESDGSWKISG